MANVAYFNTETQDYPLHEGDLSLINVDVNALPDYIVEVVIDIPEYDPNSEHIRQELPTQNNEGVWCANFIKVPYTEEEKSARALYLVRDKVMRQVPLTTEEALLLTQG